MLRECACIVVTILGTASSSLGACPAPDARNAAACSARATPATIAACFGDAAATEACAGRARGALRARHLLRAASEFVAAGVAAGPRTRRGRQWLAHATVLQERVQDDPDAPAVLRERARRDELAANAVLFHR